MLGARYIVLLAFFCDKGCSDGGWDEINSDEACFVCLFGSVMSVWCEDSLISHKGWYRERVAGSGFEKSVK